MSKVKIRCSLTEFRPPICAMSTRLYWSPDYLHVVPNWHKMPHFPPGNQCKYDDQDAEESFSVSNWSTLYRIPSLWLAEFDHHLSLPYFWSWASAVEIEINFIRTVLSSQPPPHQWSPIVMRGWCHPADINIGGSNCVLPGPGALNVKLGWLRTFGQVLLAFYSM